MDNKDSRIEEYENAKEYKGFAWVQIERDRNTGKYMNVVFSNEDENVRFSASGNTWEHTLIKIFDKIDQHHEEKRNN